jgi:hypothetical protein
VLEVFNLKSKFALACTLVCAILFIGAAFAGTFGPRLICDTYVDAEVEDESFGTEDTLWVYSKGGIPKMITYLNFEKIGSKSADEIESATLEMYVTEVEEAGNVSVYFSDEGFYEDTQTWADGLEYAKQASDTVYIDDEGRVEFDVTEITRLATVECQSCPFTIVLVADGYAEIGFTSKQGAEDEQPTLSYTTFE